jgi:site-specific DNA-methyltransferase (adenine-specific)
VNDKTENGGKSLVSFRQALYFQEIGFVVNDVMIWRKTNPMPVVKQPRYTDVFEYMFVFSKGKPKTFNPIMVPCKCAGQEYHSTTKNMGGENGRTYKEFNINKEKIKENVWDFAIAQNKTGHPAVFPQNLIEEHIKSWSNEGDLVLDPFMGSGTTALAAKKLNRKYVGIEINEEYCNLINDRINNSINK